MDNFIKMVIVFKRKSFEIIQMSVDGELVKQSRNLMNFGENCMCGPEMMCMALQEQRSSYKTIWVVNCR